MKKFIYYIVSPVIVGYDTGRLIGLGFTQGKQQALLLSLYGYGNNIMTDRCSVRDRRGESLRSHFKALPGVDTPKQVDTLISFVLTSEKASGRRLDVGTLKVSNLSSLPHMG